MRQEIFFKLYQFLILLFRQLQLQKISYKRNFSKVDFKYKKTLRERERERKRERESIDDIK